mmetsp:Transcript_17961/g.33470  ORF Transcript_17961/g.33470 Transcript_17961/m.33470 type:complete len:84 (+) Transcript_17961:1443-1694(+)
MNKAAKSSAETGRDALGQPLLEETILRSIVIPTNSIANDLAHQYRIAVLFPIRLITDGKSRKHPVELCQNLIIFISKIVKVNL